MVYSCAHLRRSLLLHSVCRSGPCNRKIDRNRTELDRLGPIFWLQLHPLRKWKNRLHEPVSTGFRGNRLPTWYPLKMRTFWAYFEEKQAKIAWVMAKTICFGIIRLCMTSHSCIFGVLHNFFHHKKYMGTYYTLCTIVYNWFYVKNPKKIIFFMCYNKIWF